MPNVTTNVDQLLQTAQQHHHAGRVAEAEQVYRQILAQQPRHADALHLLGVLAVQAGRADIAVNLIRQVIALKPNSAEAHNDLGIALSGVGKLDEVVAAHRRAIALKPNYPAAYYNLGNALSAQGQLDEAIAAYQRAIDLSPNFPQAHHNLGNALRAKGQLPEAIAAYRQAIALKPDHFEFHNALGRLMQQNKQLDEAILAFRRAIALRPDCQEAHLNLGVVLLETRQPYDAIPVLRQAIALRPGCPEAHLNLGTALAEIGQRDNAIAAHRQAIALRPDFPEAYLNLGAALLKAKEWDHAIALFRQAIALRPNYPEAYVNLGPALVGIEQRDDAIAAYQQAIALKPDLHPAHINMAGVLKDRGQLDEAIAAFRQALALRPDYAEGHSALLYTLNYHVGFDASAIAEEAQRWNRQHAEPLRKFIQPHLNDRDPARRLRIGYVSPDFREHPIGRFMLPLLANHDHQNFEVSCYSDVLKADATTEQLRSHTDRWHSIVGLSHAQASELIRQHQIDILVDLTMHMGDSRLLVFARKPAPIQLTYLAYCSTTGLTAIDYRLTDPYLDPQGIDESVYSERTVRLPNTYWCYQPTASPPIGALPAMKAGHITFGCLNNFCKVTPPTLTAWAAILRSVPTSHLLLHACEGSHRQRTADVFQNAGVDPNRLRFVGVVPMIEYLNLYQQIDIALDPFPYGGGTTTCDTLWMGVPMVSLRGETGVGRAGLSILSNVGLPELVAQTQDQYIHIATALAGNKDRLAELRSTLRTRMQESPLMNAPQFARDIEAAYRQMWTKWCLGQS